MKSIVLIKLFLLCIQSISCNERILSKFHQNIFKIRDGRMQVISYNKEYYDIFKVQTFKYNRTTPAINITLKFKVAVKDKLEVLHQTFKFLSNEYRHFPMRFQINLKKAYDANAMGLRKMNNCGNFGNFTFEKGVTYHTCNFVVDDSRLPPLIPNGQYRFDFAFLYLNEEISSMSFFGEIYTPIAYPK